MLDNDNVFRVLSEFGQQVVNRSRANFRGKNATRKGIDSVKYDLDVFKNSFGLSFEMEDYMNFQDKGVKGVESGSSTAGYHYKHHPTPYKKGAGVVPPSSAFDKWTIMKGLAGRDANGRFLTRKGLNRAIAINIYKHGIKPSLFFTKAFEREFKDLPDDLVEAYGLDVEKLMKSTLKSNDIK
tara:strand:- start:53 stop:598 length:546 start_codon:yes stop_codon:yes gene_type:complete